MTDNFWEFLAMLIILSTIPLLILEIQRRQ